jgi:tripartite-type tricarboxylate transporter receptor subunit TctC
MKLPHRRQFLHLSVGAATLPALSRVARAQAYPTRPVRIISPVPPGGATDLYARLIAQGLSQRLGKQFIVETRPGAGGSIATESVVRSAPDGYTLLLAGSNDAWNTTIYNNLKFEFARDIAPIGGINTGMGVLVVHPSFPARSVLELILAAKANPGKITVASAGIGTAPHIFWELFRNRSGVDMVHVPYRGGGPAYIDLLGGQVQVYFATLAGAIEHIRAGKLRPLGVTGAMRTPILPDVPTIGDFVPGYEAGWWQGLGAPKNTPRDIIEKLNKEINSALADAKIRERISELGDAPFPTSPDEFGKFIIEYTEKWAKVIRAAGIKAE